MALDLGLVAEKLGLALSVAPSLILAKAVVIFGLGRLLGLRMDEGSRTGLLLAGGGVFAFVLISLAGGAIGRVHACTPFTHRHRESLHDSYKIQNNSRII